MDHIAVRTMPALDDADLSGGAPARAGRHPGAVVATQTTRRAVRSGALWGYIFGLTVATSALGYAATYKTAAARDRFAELFANNSGLAAVTGPAKDIQTVAGYTAWKSFMFLMLAGAVWGLLIATKLLRGEEDAGRWELLLAGQTTRRRATAQGLVGLGAGLGVLWILSAIITIVVGRSSRVHIGASAAAFYAVALLAAPALFMAAGALASQLAATRRQAAAYTGAVLGAFYALRMVADSGAGLEWLRWLTPLGWIEELQPLTSPRPLLLLPVGVLTGILGALAVHLAGKRDLGTSVLPDGATPVPHTRLLSGPVGLAVRIGRPVFLGWMAGIGALALLMGFIAKQGGKALTSSATIEKAVSRLGTHGASAAAYLGFAFLMVAVAVTLVAAGQITAIRSEEAAGRLEHLLVRPVSRSRWLAGRAGVAFAAVIASGLVAGLFAWFGAVSQDAGVSLASLLAAGLNLIPPALCILGVGLLAMGVAPRATSAATYGLLAWSFLMEIVAGASLSNHWLLDTSLFHQMAASPGVSPDWTSAAGLTAFALATGLLGGLALRRRDLAGD